MALRRRGSGAVDDSDLLTLTEERTSYGAIVRVDGEVQVATAPRLREVLVRLETDLPDGALIAVDLSLTTFLDSTGLGVLVGSLKRVREGNGDVKLIVATEQISRLLETVGLTKVFDVLHDESSLGAEGPLRLLADLTQRTEALDRLVAIIARGADVWNEWRAGQPERVDLSDLYLPRADLTGFDLSRCDLRRAHLVGARLRSVSLRQADLGDADLRSTSMTDCDLSDARCVGVELSEADITHLRADRAVLSRARMEGVAILSSSAPGTTWVHTTFTDGSLQGSVLDGARLTDVTFSRSDLTDSDLRRARLEATSIRSCLLAGCRLGGSVWNEVVLADSDYSAAEGLGEVVHEGRSSIAVDAVARSLKHPDLGFLAAAGIPRSVGVYLVDSLRAESSDLLRYGSVFLAYSSMDTIAVDAVYDRLRQAGVNAFVARYDLLPGDDLDASIDREIGATDHVLLFCSRASLDRTTTGWWVDRELRLILERERRQARSGRPRRLLIPVLLDHHLLSEECDHPLRSDITTRVAADLSSPDAWEEELDRLLQAIRVVPFVDPAGADEGALTPRGRGAAG